MNHFKKLLSLFHIAYISSSFGTIFDNFQDISQTSNSQQISNHSFAGKILDRLITPDLNGGTFVLNNQNCLQFNTLIIGDILYSVRAPLSLDLTSTPFLSIQFGNTSGGALAQFSCQVSQSGSHLVDIAPFTNISPNGIFTYDLSTFFNNAPTNIKQILFSFQSGTPNLTADFDIKEISLDAVPEPFSIITLGTGIAGLIRKRRKTL